MRRSLRRRRSLERGRSVTRSTIYRDPRPRAADLAEVGVPVDLVPDGRRLRAGLRPRRAERHRDRDDRRARPCRSCGVIHRVTVAGSRRAAPLDLGPMGCRGRRAYGEVMEQSTGRRARRHAAVLVMLAAALWWHAWMPAVILVAFVVWAALHTRYHGARREAFMRARARVWPPAALVLVAL